MKANFRTRLGGSDAGVLHNAFPLTPALSLREREGRIPHLAEAGHPSLPDALADVLPLQEGEGRGEGERHVLTQCVPLASLSLAPGFSRVLCASRCKNRFNGFFGFAPHATHSNARPQKPLKRFPLIALAHTRLKPGANERVPPCAFASSRSQAGSPARQTRCLPHH